MANLTERIPNDTELEAMAKPKNLKAAEELEHKRQVRRKLDQYLEEAELKKSLGEDDFL